jgi:hypothetical protein
LEAEKRQYQKERSRRNVVRKTMSGAAAYPLKHSLNQLTLKLRYSCTAIWQQPCTKCYPEYKFLAEIMLKNIQKITVQCFCIVDSKASSASIWN